MRLRGWMALFLLGCGHSEPFVAGPYQAVGPLIPGPEARIAGAFGGRWTENGGGILFTTRCYGTNPAVNRKRSPPDMGIIGGLELIPASGGSIVWERCETRPEYTQSTDTTEIFPAFAMGADGRLLYAEVIRDIDRSPLRPGHFPASAHADLWLGDSNSAFTVRRKLLTLLRVDALGHAVVPPTAINYLINAEWVGQSTFVVEALNVTPDSTFTRFGLARGTITSDTTLLTVLPGTRALFKWSPAENGSSVIFVEDSLSLTLRREALTGGTVTAVATIPPGARRNIIDVSCRGDFCLVLTNDDAVFPTRISTFWTVSLSTGAVTLLRTDQKTYTSAKLSPGANLVLVGASDGMHLFSELLH